MSGAGDEESGPGEASLTCTPIGYARTPFLEKAQAPRQATLAKDVKGTIELLPAYEHAVDDLATWDRIWVVFWFHLVSGWRSKVLPPRATQRRGLFATRSPHRPNPIGMSVVRLEAVRGTSIDVRDIDLLDGTPILDIKPYVPYCDAFPDAGHGWLETDPIVPFAVVWSTRAAEQLAWLGAVGVELRQAAERVLALGPEPHPYRRIRERGIGPDGGRSLRLAVKAWRVDFHVSGSERELTVDGVISGYRPAELARAAASDDPALKLHAAFVAAWS